MGKKILGTTRVSTNRKISLLKDVADKLKAGDGDDIVFYEDNGRIYIDKA